MSIKNFISAAKNTLLNRNALTYQSKYFFSNNKQNPNEDDIDYDFNKAETDFIKK